MKIIKLFFLIAFIFSLSSCDEDFFAPVVELDIAPHTSKLAISANFVPNSDSLRVYVGKSYGFLDPKFPSFNNSFSTVLDTVTGVQVQLFKNEVLWATFKSAKNGYYTSGQKIVPNESATYRLQVSAPNYETAIATQKQPSTVPIVNATFTPLGASDPSGQKLDV